MVSFDSVLAFAACSGEREIPTPNRQRRDWVRGEVRCLMCARLVGWLLGARSPTAKGDRSLSAAITFCAYRSADMSRQVTAFTCDMRFRCSDCGGTGAVEEIDFFSTYDELPLGAEDLQPRRRGPGRPPRAVTPTEPRPQGLALALTRLADNA